MVEKVCVVMRWEYNLSLYPSAHVPNVEQQIITQHMWETKMGGAVRRDSTLEKYLKLVRYDTKPASLDA